MENFLISKKHYELLDYSSNIKQLTAYNRINTLTTIYNAKHGWLGTSFSCAEILTTLYFDIIDTRIPLIEQDLIILGKGHAAPMQYSCLAGLGIIPVEDLLKYKCKNGLQAHTDISTPGIFTNSGSLGQALSKSCGIAKAQPGKKVYVIIGDGELQEGQNYEAFQTIIHYNIKNLVIIIDRNGIQSDSNVSDIMKMNNLKMILEGFGFSVKTIVGNCIVSVQKCFNDKIDSPTVILADTCKGHGVSFLSAGKTKRREYKWHGQIPEKSEYVASLKELNLNITNPDVKSKIKDFLLNILEVSKKTKVTKSDLLSTGSAFANEIEKLLRKYNDMFIFDADLEKPCKLTSCAENFPGQYIEMGISEQDMVSTAGGFALSGKLPVVNTYASFFRRAYEQIYVNSTEQKKIIYAGHYSGLCYTTDGKTHQCTGDIAMMRAIPEMIVLYPAFIVEIPLMLDWYLNNVSNQPVYFRLHRTPVDLKSSIDSVKIEFQYGSGLKICNHDSKEVILTSGPHMTDHCQQIADYLNIDLYSISSLSFISENFIKSLSNYDKIFIFEELIKSGGLLDLISKSFADYNLKLPEIRHKSSKGFTYSTRDPKGLYKLMKLDIESLKEFILAQ